MRFQKLRNNRPAPTTNITANAISAITRPRRTRLRAAPAVVRLPASRNARPMLFALRCSRGARLNRRPVPIASRSVKTRTGASSVTEAARGMLPAFAATSACSPKQGRARPAAAPLTERTELSATNCLIRREPDLDVLIVHVESGRHDADNGRLRAVDVDLTADDAAITGERTLPELRGEHGHRGRVREHLFGCECPTETRRDGERREQARGDDGRRHARRVSLSAEVHRAGDVRADV